MKKKLSITTLYASAIAFTFLLITQCSQTENVVQPQLKAGSTVVVRALGISGAEHINVTVAGAVVGSWTLTTSYTNYSCTTASTGDIRVVYDNDATGRDVQVDYITVNGTTRQAEAQTINTGVYANGRCGGGSNSEWLHCNGYIDFGDVGGTTTGGGTTATFEVAAWSGFRSAAVSYTYDDNCSNQLAIAIPAMNTYGFKATLFAVTTWSPNWAGLKTAVASGHEVGSHTMTHPNMNTLTVAQQTSEITGSISAITSNVGVKPITLAWPNCNLGNETLAQQYFIAARSCSGQIVPATPGDFMNISSFICGNLGTVKTNADFQSKANSAASAKGWVVYLVHGIDNDGGYSPTSSTELKNSFAFFNTNSATFWVAPFSSVARYIKERNAATVTQTASDAASVTLKVSDNLDNGSYDVPLTLRTALPSGWTNAGATQNGLTITSSIVTVNAVKYIMFNVVPDGGDIKLTKK